MSFRWRRVGSDLRLIVFTWSKHIYFVDWFSFRVVFGNSLFVDLVIFHSHVCPLKITWRTREYPFNRCISTINWSISIIFEENIKFGEITMYTILYWFVLLMFEKNTHEPVLIFDLTFGIYNKKIRKILQFLRYKYEFSIFLISMKFLVFRSELHGFLRMNVQITVFLLNTVVTIVVSFIT